MKVVIDKISLMTCCFRPSSIRNAVDKALEEAGFKEKYYDPKIENEVFVVEDMPKDPLIVDVEFKEL
jgi:hypothetical protein